MTLIKDVTNCSTIAVRGLDNQLIWQFNQLKPGLLARIDDIPNLILGEAVHPWLQKGARDSLAIAIKERGKPMIINSAYRTLAGQALLRSHADHRRCGIVAAAPPGSSNHNGASAIDIEDAYGWERCLEKHGWNKLGDFDPMHFDYLKAENILRLSILAFQKLWNRARPLDKLNEDGSMGQATMGRLLFAPAEGFPIPECPRFLRFTDPVQQGDDVGKVQLALQSKGIPCKADKVYGVGTNAAIKEFQVRNGLTADGILGKKTLEMLGLAAT
jgi:hypothetical protein